MNGWCCSEITIYRGRDIWNWKKRNEGLNNHERIDSFSGDSFGFFDGFHLFEKEGSDDFGLDAAGAEDSAVGSGDGFLSFGESFIVVGSELCDAVDSFSAVAWVVWGVRAFALFSDVMNDDFGAGSSDFSDFVGCSVVA